MQEHLSPKHNGLVQSKRQRLVLWVFQSLGYFSSLMISGRFLIHSSGSDEKLTFLVMYKCFSKDGQASSTSASWEGLNFVLNYRDQAWVEKLPWCLVALIPTTIPSKKIYITIALLEVRHLRSCVPGSVEHLAQYGSVGRAMDTTRAESPALQSHQPAAFQCHTTLRSHSVQLLP